MNFAGCCFPWDVGVTSNISRGHIPNSWVLSSPWSQVWHLKWNHSLILPISENTKCQALAFRQNYLCSVCLSSSTILGWCLCWQKQNQKFTRSDINVLFVIDPMLSSPSPDPVQVHSWSILGPFLVHSDLFHFKIKGSGTGAVVIFTLTPRLEYSAILQKTSQYLSHSVQSSKTIVNWNMCQRLLW